MLGERLKDLRDYENLRQQDISNILGIHRAHYSAWERNKETIPLKQLNKICNHYNVSMDYMIGKTRTMKGNGIHELNSKIIGQNLRTIRKKHNLSQSDLAKILNVDQTTISGYEIGDYTILTDFAIQIAKTYNISLDWLCGRTEK